MLDSLKRALGFAEKEYSHIVAGFQKMKDDLADLRSRKLARVQALSLEISDKTGEQAAVQQAAATASNIIDALSKIVG